MSLFKTKSVIRDRIMEAVDRKIIEVETIYEDRVEDARVAYEAAVETAEDEAVQSIVGKLFN